MLNNKVYDVLKWVTLILLPATATLIGAIGGYVDWALTDLVVYIIVSVTTFLGTILGISTLQYNKEEV